MKILNLYAGLGGNRKLWTGHEITAVELDPRIAAVYRRLYPDDTVVEGDAHEYLIKHFREFDFIWTSPPCQTHGRMAQATRHRLDRYVDLSLYQEIILLRHKFAGHWVVENVKPFYTPLVEPTFRVGRHVFWSSFPAQVDDVPTPPNFINLCNVAGKQALMEWLGIHYPENIYYGTNHCPAQILRNCVHPLVGQRILENAMAAPVKTRKVPALARSAAPSTMEFD